MTEKKWIVDEDDELRLFYGDENFNGSAYPCNDIVFMKMIADKLNKLEKENEQLQKDATTLIYVNQDYRHENEKLKSENKRLTDKLNKTALELVDGYISQGKATEISEMSYREFLDYRAKNGKPMELKI